MMVKSGLEKICLKFLLAEAIFSNILGHLQKITNLPSFRLEYAIMINETLT